jgi:hypothetical protein
VVAYHVVVYDVVVHDVVVYDRAAVRVAGAGREGQECRDQHHARRGCQAEPLNHYVFPPMFQASSFDSGTVQKPG